MAVHAENPYPYPRGYAPRPSCHGKSRRRQARRRKWLLTRLSALAAVIVLAIAALALCRSAAMTVWENFRSTMEPVDTDVLFVSTDSGHSLRQTAAPRDIQAPTLSGVQDILFYQGETVDYLAGVTALDDADPNPTITVDDAGVDLSQPGEYTLTYTATDASGNAGQTTAKVTVLEWREGYQDLGTIYAEADAFLMDIVEPGDSIRQQVVAIYAWARSDLSYGSHSDRTDWRQTAYTMLTEGRGDCFGFFAVTKLLFERLGIPNIDVRKVRNYEGDSDHFWSLVSLDDGKTWYHFDATPRQGSGDDFCLVTDDFLDAYSDAHRGSHNRDKSLYPATP